VVAVTLLLFGLLLLALISRGATTNQDDLLRSRAEQAARTTSAANLIASPPVAPSDLHSSNDVFIEVVDGSGAVLYATGQLDGHAPPVPSGLLNQASLHHGAFVTDGDAAKGTQLRLYAIPVTGGYLVAGQSTKVPASNVSGVVVFLVVSAVPTLIAAMVASWLVAGRALRPLREVAGTAVEIGRTRDFARRLPARRSRDEVALLTQGFNGMLGALEDAYRAVAAALDAQRRFVADASHELRTPLATIQGNAGMLAHGPDVTDEVRRAAAADIAGESERMARLTDRLLTLARADSGLDLVLAPIELRPLTSEVVRQAASLHPDLSITVNAAELSVAGDADALRQLLWILLENAARHARQTITVDLQREGGWARLNVADDGPGIPPAERELVFQRFYKKDASRAGGGAGLGLAIARWIAGQHHGRIVAADGPQGGAGLFVDLPLLSPS
jgi:two-component system OmpR family sensor kinase